LAKGHSGQKPAEYLILIAVSRNDESQSVLSRKAIKIKTMLHSEAI